MDEAVKYDQGKLRYDLIPPEALEELAAVYTMGAAKYADENWRKGMSWRRVFAAIMRHAWAWMRGEDRDSESGLPHLAHAAWGCFTLMAYAKGNLGQDDRPVVNTPTMQPSPSPLFTEEESAALGAAMRKEKHDPVEDLKIQMAEQIQADGIARNTAYLTAHANLHGEPRA